MTIGQRALARLFVIAGLVTTVIAGVAMVSPANAASCHGSSCTGKDPSSTGCDSSGFVYNMEYRYLGQDMSLQLRRSSGCDVYWARVINDTSKCCGTYEIKIQQQLRSPYGWYDWHVYFTHPYYGDTGHFWTRMVGDKSTGDVRTRACFGGSSCTGWY